MNPTGKEEEKPTHQRVFNLTLAAVAGQVGCLTLVIIFGALIGGLWLDNRFDSRPLFTILLMVGSVPFTLVSMFWVVRKTTKHIKPVVKEEDQENVTEEADRGRNS